MLLAISARQSSHGEMSGVKPVHFRLWQVLQVGLATLAREEYVVLAPEDDGLRLPVPEKLLPLRVQGDIGSVIVEQVDQDPSAIGRSMNAKSDFQLSGLISSSRRAPCK